MKIIKDKNVYSVSEVNFFARQTLEQMILWVEGEISRCDKSPSYNFYYLTLKDENAILQCVVDGSVLDLFEDNLVGQKVLAYGYLSLYEPRGQYQLKILRLESVGEGLLYKKLEELIIKLKAEGLFAIKHKKPLPAYPKKVCLITSHGSDAENDFKRHSQDKFSLVELYIFDVRMQGPKSVPQLLKILPKADKLGFDVIVITRGGGSIEDLAAFNDESVARIIFKIKTPTVVAIGHEANESLAEWTSDVRASTPTDAANLVVAGYTKLLEELKGHKKQLQQKADYLFSPIFQKMDYLFYRLKLSKTTFKDLPHRLQAASRVLKSKEKYLIRDGNLKLDELIKSMAKSKDTTIENNRQKLKQINHSFLLLSPKNILERGYAITKDSQGKFIKSINSVVVKSVVGVELVDGSFTSIVKSMKAKNG